MFLCIRGPFGSGKTTTINNLIENFLSRGSEVGTCSKTVVLDGKDKIKHFGHYFEVEGLSLPVFLMGKYGDAACGGIDTINYKGAHDDICDVIRDHAETHHIIFEGSIISNCYNRYNRLAGEIGEKGIDHRFWYLNTPLEVCEERVIKRRNEKHAAKLEKVRIHNEEMTRLGKLKKLKKEPELKDFNPANLIKMKRQMGVQMPKTIDQGYKVIEVSDNDSIHTQMLELMEG
jgi:thymidylate kinase